MAFVASACRTSANRVAGIIAFREPTASRTFVRSVADRAVSEPAPTPSPAPAPPILVPAHTGAPGRAVDPTWLFYNSERHRLVGVNQKAISPLAVGAAPTRAVRVSPVPPAGAGAVPSHLSVTWADGRVEAVPVSFLERHDYSAAALEDASRAATPSFLGMQHAAPSSASSSFSFASSSALPPPPPLLLPTPRPLSRKEEEGRAAVAGETPSRASPLHAPLGRDRVPSFDFAAARTDDAHLHSLLRAVNEHGIAIVRGAGTEPGSVLQIASRLGYGRPCLPTIYGSTWEVKNEAARAINIAYNALGLDLHVDLVYYESPPGLQLLHCREFDDDVVGGESTFVDGFYAAEVLRARDPRAFAVLSRVPATFEKVHFEREQPVLMRYQRPHLVVSPPSGVPLASPSSSSSSSSEAGVVTSVFWAPMFEGVLRVHPDDVAPYYEAYAAFADVLADVEHDGRMLIEYRAEPGEIVVFNNRRMLHGRRAFAQRRAAGAGGGRRLLEGCYVSVDEYKSRYAYLTWRFEGEAGLRRVKRVGNQDHSL